MPEPIKDIEDFFNKTTTKLLKTQGKNFIKIYNELIHVTKKRASKLNGSIINLLQLACSWIEDSTCTPIWQPLIDISAEILNCYGSFDSDDAQIFDLLFQPLLEDNSEGRSDLFMFIERILTKIQAGFSFLISDYFKKMFTDALSSNAKSKLQESYNLLQIVHIHIPDSIHTVLHIHHLYLKSENIKQREIGIKFLIDVLSGVYTVKFKQDELPILDDFCARFGDNELSCQQLMVANLSTFLLRSSDITSKLIKPILDCFQSVDTSLSISKAIVEQISIAIKDCYHAAPNELLYLLLSACSHKAPHVAIECIHTCSYLYRIYYVKDTYSSPTRLRLETVPRFILAAAIEHKDIGVRVEAQCCFFQNIIFERYRPLERTRQFFLFAQTDLGRDGIKNYGKLLTSQSELRDLVDKALSKYYSSDNSELFIADESLTELNDDAKRLLQQISDLCFSKKDNGVRKIHNYFSTLDSSFKEELQTLRTDSTLDTSSLSLQKTIIDSADMSKSSLSAQSMLVYERLCPRLQIVFSHDFLEQFPDAAQTYFTEETARNDTDDEEKDMSDSEKANVEQTINNYERRAIRQIGKLAKVICPVIEAAMDVEILEKFVGVIDEQKPVLNTFIYALLADFGGLLNPGALKSDLIDHLFGVIYNDIVNGASTTISKWAIRAFVQIIGSNQNHLEQSYIDLFEKTKSYWILTDEDVAAPSRWLLLSHVVKHAPQTDTMFKIIRHLFKMIRQIAKV
ncbi:unnamed protein product [Didymodactylos carnosus]|uniref:Uncharacterized protein n=1 Tax=Didymodactylos carnosus TaxID=1234261 RepID=A0A8S2EJ06_9BILA|nr:unnamed protein product [Didymodactylos carnosus]CAF3987546.1 unnamed protein product [Didymodactylos carnosus]